MAAQRKKDQPRVAVATDLELGKRIRTQRVELGMSQKELARRLGVTFQQVQKYEKGRNRVNASRLRVIATALNMRPEDFFQSEVVLPDVSSLIDVDNKMTLRMLRAYSRISDQATQRKMVELIETIANAATD